eukprot:COSAG01_NODE_9307_length_2487_cov_2.839682_1_plen_129_part_00
MQPSPIVKSQVIVTRVDLVENSCVVRQKFSSESDDTRGLWGLLRATRAAMAFLLALPPERLSLGDRSLISTTLRPPLRPTGPGHLCTAGRKSLDRRGCDIRTNCGGDLPPPSRGELRILLCVSVQAAG